MTTKINENALLGLKYSFYVTGVSMLIFLFAKIFHLERVVELRFSNYIVLFFIAYAALNRSYRMHENKIEYFNGFSIAFITGALGFLWYSILFYIYLHLDHN